MSAFRFLPGLGARRRTPSDAGEVVALDSARAVLRATRGAVEVMRLADAEGRRAHAERDLDGFDAAWRSYHDAQQVYRVAASHWEDVVAAGPVYLEELPVAPAWSSNDLETELAPLVIDLSVDAPQSAEIDAKPADEPVHESR